MDFRRADSHSIERAIDIGLCNVCLTLYLDPKDEAILQKEPGEVRSKINAIAPSIMRYGDESSLREALSKVDVKPLVCPGCFNCLSGDAMGKIAELVLSFAETCAMHTNSIALEFVIPPVLDAVRLTARTAITRNPLKIFPFPTISELLGRYLKTKLASTLNIVDVAGASYIITLTAHMENQAEFCLKMNSTFQLRKPKRKFMYGMALPSKNDETSSNISRDNTDHLLITYKNLNSEGFDTLRSNLVEFASGLSATVPPVSWKCDFSICPVYLFGRYRKLARDVPQAPWSVASSGKNEDDEDDAPAPVVLSTDEDTTLERMEDIEQPSSSSVVLADKVGKPLVTHQRKGRNSVEEIIAHAACQVLQATGCRLHPCGREDIDVRCLGNGRPFAFEVNGAALIPTRERLDEIVRSVNSMEGLNTEGDVELFKMSVSNRQLWEGMQEKAEEKRKGYCCVVWSADKIDRTKLKVLEEMCTSGAQRDEEGRPCIEISQKTPLRVMHRRSLLTRKRYIYNIETALVNDHFFIMRLVTAAGTYVKEFVHGDLGRTVPNVSAIINCQTDILQLDVTWLYDDFEGGGEDVSGGNYIDASVYSGIATVVERRPGSVEKDTSSRKGSKKDGSTRDWKSMRDLNLASYSSS